MSDDKQKRYSDQSGKNPKRYSDKVVRKNKPRKRKRVNPLLGGIQKEIGKVPSFPEISNRRFNSQIAGLIVGGIAGYALSKLFSGEGLGDITNILIETAKAKEEAEKKEKEEADTKAKEEKEKREKEEEENKPKPRFIDLGD